MSATSGSSLGHHGFAPPGPRPDYKTYRSPHAPQYKINTNFHGIDRQRAIRFGTGAVMFAGALGAGALYFISDVPRVRRDIMMKIPGMGWYFKREIAPEDNPF